MLRHYYLSLQISGSRNEGIFDDLHPHFLVLACTNRKAVSVVRRIAGYSLPDNYCPERKLTEINKATLNTMKANHFYQNMLKYLLALFQNS